MEANQTTRRKWYTFSLREVAISMIAIGAVLAWLNERRIRDNDRHMNFPVSDVIDALKAKPKAIEAITRATIDGRVVVVYAYPSEGEYKAMAEDPQQAEGRFYFSPTLGRPMITRANP